MDCTLDSSQRLFFEILNLTLNLFQGKFRMTHFIPTLTDGPFTTDFYENLCHQRASMISSEDSLKLIDTTVRKL
jgi:hypothetical protein